MWKGGLSLVPGSPHRLSIMKGPRRTSLAPGSPDELFISKGPRRTPLVSGSPYGQRHPPGSRGPLSTI
eukprot:931028-Pyramimonas_sp.AAC.1